MRVLVLILSLFIFTAVNADVKGQALSKTSQKISSEIFSLYFIFLISSSMLKFSE